MSPDDRPLLRAALEPLSVEIDGRRAIALHDPEAYCKETAIVEPGLLGLLALFDGSRTLDDIRTELARHGAGFVSLEKLQELVASLDRYYLLESERFRAAALEREQEFAGLSVREAAHAGGAYPEDPKTARIFFQDMLDQAQAEDEETLARLIAPHIDFRLGAEVYARAHRRLHASGRPDVVVVLGVCHAPSTRRFIACRKDFDTPQGAVRHDARLLDALEQSLGEDLSQEQLLHRSEHSVEFQAAWLAHLWPEDPPRIVPLLVGSFQEFVEAELSPSANVEIEAFVQALREVIRADGRRIVLLASVDLAHLGPRYGDRAGLDEEDEQRLEEEDRRLLEQVAAGDAEAFFREVSRDGNARNICGIAPVYLTLRAGDGAGELLSYGQGRIDPASGSVVSFASLAFAG